LKPPLPALTASVTSLSFFVSVERHHRQERAECVGEGGAGKT